MSGTDESRKPQRGDEQRDPDGTVWIVVGHHSENGPYYSGTRRVRKGSLAHETIFGRSSSS